MSSVNASVLLPCQVDRIFRYPRGRAARLAKQKKIPHVVLPDGEIRFRQEDIDNILRPKAREVAYAS